MNSPSKDPDNDPNKLVIVEESVPASISHFLACSSHLLECLLRQLSASGFLEVMMDAEKPLLLLVEDSPVQAASLDRLRCVQGKLSRYVRDE